MERNQISPVTWGSSKAKGRVRRREEVYSTDKKLKGKNSWSGSCISPLGVLKVFGPRRHYLQQARLAEVPAYITRISSSTPGTPACHYQSVRSLVMFSRTHKIGALVRQIREPHTARSGNIEKRSVCKDELPCERIFFKNTLNISTNHSKTRSGEAPSVPLPSSLRIKDPVSTPDIQPVSIVNGYVQVSAGRLYCGHYIVPPDNFKKNGRFYRVHHGGTSDVATVCSMWGIILN
ncbi:hypothetical protein CBL_05983 [Carabus blaptoides fortunei]